MGCDTDRQPILTVEAIRNTYQSEPLLKGVSFQMLQGEILCLLGSSGSGKTTLLRIIAGLEEHQGGAVLFGGRDLAKVPPHKRRIGMMFQEYALFPHRTVSENVAFGLDVRRVSEAEKTTKVKQMLDLVGLADFGDRRIDQLSGGERQRVALARSLAPEPQLLLLDEPLGSLDRRLRDRLADEIRSILKKLGVTAIFVTHDREEAFGVADKVAVLHAGILQQVDCPEEIYRYPASKLVARFLGFDNLIDGLVDATGTFHAFATGLKPVQPLCSSPEQTGPATLLLRPEGARIAEEQHTDFEVSGRVMACRFVGGNYMLSLSTGEITLCFSLPIDPSPPAVGAMIRLSLSPASLVLLPQQNGGEAAGAAPSGGGRP